MKRTIIFILIAVIIIGGIIYTLKSKPSNNSSVPPTSKTTSNISSKETPEISFLSNTEREAVFTTSVPLKGVDMSNVRVYTKSASVTGAGQEDNFPKNYFNIKYDPKDLTITITDISNEFGNDFGAFKTGCAACTHEIEFTNLETTSGIKIPNIHISIY